VPAGDDLTVGTGHHRPHRDIKMGKSRKCLIQRNTHQIA
jgi:hypothetical protein